MFVLFLPQTPLRALRALRLCEIIFVFFSRGGSMATENFNMLLGQIGVDCLFTSISNSDSRWFFGLLFPFVLSTLSFEQHDIEISVA